MLSGEFLAIIKTAGEKMIYVDYYRAEIDNFSFRNYFGEF